MDTLSSKTVVSTFNVVETRCESALRKVFLLHLVLQLSLRMITNQERQQTKTHNLVVYVPLIIYIFPSIKTVN